VSTMWKATEKSDIPGLLRWNAERQPQKVAMHFEDEGASVSYERLQADSYAFANALHDLGVRSGDTVACFMTNCADMVDTWFGCAQLGAVFVPINTAYLGEYLRHQLARSQAKVAVADHDLAERVVAVADRLPDLIHLVIRGADGANQDRLQSLLARVGTTRVHPIEMLRAAESDRLRLDSPAAWNTANTVIFTAGTTGPSKGAVLTQNYLVRSARLLFDARDGREDDVCYSPLPLFHLNAMIISVLGPMTRGATGALDRRFSVSRFWERADHFRARQAAILGSMYVMLWNQAPRDDDVSHSVEVFIGGPVSEALRQPFEARFGARILCEIYALSEACPLTFTPLDQAGRDGSAGRPSPYFEVKTLDDDDEEVEPGAVGEIVCRPREPHLMFEGYYNDPEATVRQWKNLWFHTGDLGYFDADGYLYFFDRKKDYLRRRGENISSFEVEQVIASHPAVAEAAVHGVKSEFSEDDMKACVVLKDGESLSHVALWEFCKKNLPYFAVPRYLEFMESLPRNPVGRVLKYELRERSVGPATWDADATVPT
jgi:carnitine-CoA ligase